MPSRCSVAKLRVMTIIGTRPEIIRLSRVMTALDRHTDHIIVHTGQNYDHELNQVFFDDLELRSPDHYLNAAGDTAAETSTAARNAAIPITTRRHVTRRPPGRAMSASTRSLRSSGAWMDSPRPRVRNCSGSSIGSSIIGDPHFDVELGECAA